MARFGVAARTLIHLGAELITSDEIALYELIKNSFDAKSPRVSIKFVVPFPLADIALAKQKVLLSKNLSKDIPAILAALQAKQKAGCSDEVLTYTDQAIKQTQTLKTAEEIETAIDSINFIEVSDSGIGMTKAVLSNVFLLVGTDFKKHDDHDDVLLGNKGIGRLAMMRLGSRALVETWTPKEPNLHRINFNWKDFDTAEKSITDIDFPIEEQSKTSSIESGTRIKITGLSSDWDDSHVKNKFVDPFLRRLKNPFAKESRQFPIDVSINGSDRIPIMRLDEQLWSLADRHLKFSFFPDKAEKSEDAILTLKITDYKNGGIETPLSRTLKEVSKKLTASLDDLKKIGPLELSIRWYNRKNLPQNRLGTDLEKMRKELNVWSGGIAIYRDGFRVGVSGADGDGDWLGLDKDALRRGGFVVNRIQVIGALEISKKENPNLVDRSNREGLIENKETALLRELLIEFAVNSLKENVVVENEIEKKEALSELISDGTASIEDRLKLASNNISAIKKGAPENLKEHVIALTDNFNFISSQVKKYSNAVVELKERREDILELAGVGTVMHGVLHELSRTTSQTRGLISDIAKKADPKTKALLEKLESEIKAINTRLKQLDPLSPSGRQRKSEFDIVKLTNTIVSGYSARFERHEIKAIVTVDEGPEQSPMLVKMVKGYFSLALENLLTNSVFWVQDSLLAGETERIISINLDTKAKVISFRDNGPGISPADRERIFTPGFSLRHRGNGFGLYIAREVVEHHGAKLILENQPDSDGRLRTFVLELPKE